MPLTINSYECYTKRLFKYYYTCKSTVYFLLGDALNSQSYEQGHTLMEATHVEVTELPDIDLVTMINRLIER